MKTLLTALALLLTVGTAAEAQIYPDLYQYRREPHPQPTCFLYIGPPAPQQYDGAAIRRLDDISRELRLQSAILEQMQANTSTAPPSAPASGFFTPSQTYVPATIIPSPQSVPATVIPNPASIPATVIPNPASVPATSVPAPASVPATTIPSPGHAPSTMIPAPLPPDVSTGPEAPIPGAVKRPAIPSPTAYRSASNSLIAREKAILRSGR